MEGGANSRTTFQTAVYDNLGNAALSCSAITGIIASQFAWYCVWMYMKCVHKIFSAHPSPQFGVFFWSFSEFFFFAPPERPECARL